MQQAGEALKVEIKALKEITLINDCFMPYVLGKLVLSPNSVMGTSPGSAEDLPKTELDDSLVGV
jgi:hypothetical protein